MKPLSKFLARRKPNNTIPTSTPTTMSLAKSPGNQLVGGYNDSTLTVFAGEDGEAAVHNPAVSGDNEPHLVDAVNAAHDTTGALIGHGFRESVQKIDQGLELAVVTAASQEDDVLDAIDTFESEAVDLAELQAEAKAAGVGRPSHVIHVWVTLCLIALVFGDQPVIAKSFEPFHLSDAPLIPGVHLTDELHLAALAATAALLILSHLAGKKLRYLAHACNRRRLVPQAERAALPRPSAFDAVIFAACLVAAAVLLVGLGDLRVDYLRSQGEPASRTPFFLVNIGILAAAIGVGFHFASPFGRRIADAEKLVKKAKADVDEKTAGLVSTSGRANGQIDERDACLAQAGHHVGASAGNARRQGSLIARQVLLSKPEPSTERLFLEQLAQPALLHGHALAESIVGITDLPSFERLTLDRVNERREQVRDRLRAIRYPDAAQRTAPEEPEAAEALHGTASNVIDLIPPAPGAPMAVGQDIEP